MQGPTSEARSRVEIRRLVEGFSVEITSKDRDNLREAAAHLPAETRIAVTYLPGEDMEARVATAAAVRGVGHVPVPHISARRLTSADELERFLRQLRERAAIDRAFVVGGDLHEAAGPYPDAMAIIRSGALARHGVARVGIAGYPDGHPDIPVATLTRSLVEKVGALREAGHEPVINTQFSFDHDSILTWLERLRQDGVTATVRVGVPGPTSVKTLLRFAARCGVAASASVVQKYGISLTKLLSPVGPDRLVRHLAEGMDLGRHGDVRLHFYPFGGLAGTARWLEIFMQD